MRLHDPIITAISSSRSEVKSEHTWQWLQLLQSSLEEGDLTQADKQHQRHVRTGMRHSKHMMVHTQSFSLLSNIIVPQAKVCPGLFAMSDARNFALLITRSHTLVTVDRNVFLWHAAFVKYFYPSLYQWYSEHRHLLCDIDEHRHNVQCSMWATYWLQTCRRSDAFMKAALERKMYIFPTETEESTSTNTSDWDSIN